MKCEDTQLLISIYVDEALGEERSLELFSHLSGCPACRLFMRNTLDIRNAIRVLPRPALPTRGKVYPFSPAGDRNRGVRTPFPPLRALLSRRVNIPLSAAASIAAVLLAAVVGLASLWMNAEQRGAAGRSQMVYMARLPVVEVYATSSTETTKPQ
jgi:anti-sigma factor RsiW